MLWIPGAYDKRLFVHYYMYQTDSTFDLGESSTKVRSSKVEPWKVTLVNTGLRTLTAGRLQQVREYLGEDETFLLTYGDGGGECRSRGHYWTITGSREGSYDYHDPALREIRSLKDRDGRKSRIFPRKGEEGSILGQCPVLWYSTGGFSIIWEMEAGCWKRNRLRSW